MSGDAQGLPDWVRPTAAHVDAVEREALQAQLSARPAEVERLEGVLAAIAWVRATSGCGPVTDRPAPAARGEVVAEMWAAAAVSDGGATSERALRAACSSAGAAYLPPDLTMGLQFGLGAHQALAWLACSPDGWGQGRRAPVDVPADQRA